MYLLLSVGVVRSSHFCMGREINVAYFSHKADGCFTSDDRKMPCCEDVTEIVNIDEDHQGVNFQTSISNSYIILPSLIALEYQSFINLVDEQQFKNVPDPPNLWEKSIYIKFHSLTYYG